MALHQDPGNLRQLAQSHRDAPQLPAARSRCACRTCIRPSRSPSSSDPSSARSSRNAPRPAPHRAAPCPRARSPGPIRGPHHPPSLVPPTQHRRCAHTRDAPPTSSRSNQPNPLFHPPDPCDTLGSRSGAREQGSEKRGWGSWRRLNFATSLLPPIASSTS
jgi:hypothetical protein